MKLPHANDLSPALRKIGRRLLPADLRSDVAAKIEHAAHLQYLTKRAYWRSRRTLARLRNAHRGETCIIVGNGPSLRGQDLGELSFARTICLNRGYLLWNEQGRVPDYFVAVNDLVIEQFHREIAALPCPLFVPWRHYGLFSDCEHAVLYQARWKKKFFEDIAHGLWSGATVTMAAMQIAYHMGFERVILIGVDHRFATSGPPHQEVLQSSHDASHFSPEYFGKGVRWNLPDLEGSELAYRMAKSAFERDGRIIIDATVEGALEIFPKMSLNAAAGLVRKSGKWQP